MGGRQSRAQRMIQVMAEQNMGGLTEYDEDEKGEAQDCGWPVCLLDLPHAHRIFPMTSVNSNGSSRPVRHRENEGGERGTVNDRPFYSPPCVGRVEAPLERFFL